MDSLDLGNLANVHGNQNSLTIPQSNGEIAVEDHAGSEHLYELGVSLNPDNRSQIFIGPDDDYSNKFLILCAENQINAIIEGARKFHENFSRPEEFENEAVTMAIKQHGLRKNDTQNISYTSSSEEILNDSSVVSRFRTSDPELPTPSKNKGSCGITEDENYTLKSVDEGRRNKRKRHCEYAAEENIEKNNLSQEGFDYDDIYFLNEAVATAIKQKGLCSSSLDILK